MGARGLARGAPLGWRELRLGVDSESRGAKCGEQEEDRAIMRARENLMTPGGASSRSPNGYPSEQMMTCVGLPRGPVKSAAFLTASCLLLLAFCTPLRNLFDLHSVRLVLDVECFC